MSGRCAGSRARPGGSHHPWPPTLRRVERGGREVSSGGDAAEDDCGHGHGTRRTRAPAAAGRRETAMHLVANLAPALAQVIEGDAGMNAAVDGGGGGERRALGHRRWTAPVGKCARLRRRHASENQRPRGRPAGTVSFRLSGSRGGLIGLRRHRHPGTSGYRPGGRWASHLCGKVHRRSWHRRGNATSRRLPRLHRACPSAGLDELS